MPNKKEHQMGRTKKRTLYDTLMEKEPHCREQEEVEDDQGDAGDQLDEDHSEPGDDDVDDDDLYIIGAVSNEKADCLSYLFCHGGW